MAKFAHKFAFQATREQFRKASKTVKKKSPFWPSNAFVSLSRCLQSGIQMTSQTPLQWFGDIRTIFYFPKFTFFACFSAP